MPKFLETSRGYHIPLKDVVALHHDRKRDEFTATDREGVDHRVYILDSDLKALTEDVTIIPAINGTYRALAFYMDEGVIFERHPVLAWKVGNFDAQPVTYSDEDSKDCANLVRDAIQFPDGQLFEPYGRLFKSLGEWEEFVAKEAVPEWLKRQKDEQERAAAVRKAKAEADLIAEFG